MVDSVAALMTKYAGLLGEGYRAKVNVYLKYVTAAGAKKLRGTKNQEAKDTQPHCWLTKTTYSVNTQNSNHSRCEYSDPYRTV